ncbi:hypothetical protein tb265_05010 [Gemmatimonadetes bacterium T265]|nr:hypothetical protein tb265_05010 [Gemmatimonadetes bacterium T265]
MRPPSSSILASLVACGVLAPAYAAGQGAPLPAYAPARDSAQRFAGRPAAPSRTSPAGGDTAGYWQQRADYQIIARLDEAREVLVATARLTYVNASPDTLRELFVHQHLNAFRPGSRWAADDAREGRVRFQTLGKPAYGFERFTAAPQVDGVAVRVEYPGAPDSTVAHFLLPHPLAPHDSAVVTFAWEARPSTILRRQGRRGRSYDFAQWFPKVAVYDRGGWQPHALVPSGELYGEFGTFDVTLILADDQVVGATGVPVEGDPGWARVSRSGPVRTGADAYGVVTPGPRFKLRPGERSVRFLARGVHHFGWSTSPDYRYEGGAYVRGRPAGAPGGRFAVWDTVRVHALYRPGDDTTFGGGRAVARTVATLGWLERVYGPYGYPQMTVLHRLEGGGTEFPMLQMNGGAQQSLILHEGGHVYSYGLLANNEWQSGWMDEGLTSYQTSWALGETRADLASGAAARPAVAPPPPPAQLLGNRRALDRVSLLLDSLTRMGRTQPVGLRGDLFADFATYNLAVYTRAERMYGALRDVLGDSAFAAFLRDYYARWAFRHVDEAAMRASAERVAPADRPWERDLGWFFTQWVHDVGSVDYALRDVRSARTGPAGAWETRATLVRTGAYRHPMPVGVRTAAGWTVVRGDPRRDRETLVITTPPDTAAPLEVRLDPYGATEATTARFYVTPRSARDLTAPSTGRAP